MTPPNKRFDICVVDAFRVFFEYRVATSSKSLPLENTCCAGVKKKTERCLYYAENRGYEKTLTVFFNSLCNRFLLDHDKFPVLNSGSSLFRFFFQLALRSHSK